MTHGVKVFWWLKMNKEIQNTGTIYTLQKTRKNKKSQLPMTEVNFLPPTEKPNQEIQLDFIGPIRFKQRRFFILVSKDRYSGWSAACICETPTGKTAASLLDNT